MSCKRVCDIKPREKSQTIDIRVLKKWICTDKKEELCYQFVDSYGDGIEATAELRDQKFFDLIIQLHSCYRVSRYICTYPRSYMATVGHAASLVIGRKAIFEPLANSNIPTVYFNFATYDVLKSRIKDTKLLTDYIGRVEKNSMIPTSTRQWLRKVVLQDERKNPVAIILWPKMQHLIGDEVVRGDIIAITSTKVSEYDALLQLEPTQLTTTTINPNLPETAEHVNRLNALPTMQITDANEKQVTVHELVSNKSPNNQTCTRFRCHARIKEIHDYGSWYYVQCSKCSKKLYPVQEEDGSLNFVCKDDDNIVPHFMYCVDATITDATGTADVVFFNEGMNALLNISCKDMVTKHGYTHPKKWPHLMASKIDIPKLLHLTVKDDGKMVVKDVTELTTTLHSQSTSAERRTYNLPPTTPNPKTITPKRPYSESPDTSKSKRKA